jgi:hypothetical protein
MPRLSTVRRAGRGSSEKFLENQVWGEKIQLYYGGEVVVSVSLAKHVTPPLHASQKISCLGSASESNNDGHVSF